MDVRLACDADRFFVGRVDESSVAEELPVLCWALTWDSAPPVPDDVVEVPSGVFGASVEVPADPVDSLGLPACDVFRAEFDCAAEESGNDESPVSAPARPGLLATATPTPSATARAPTRPTNRA